MAEATRGILYILSAPSGTGKTEVSRRLRVMLPNLKKSVSYTTRPPRGTEKDQIDYNFVSRSDFDDLRKKEHFFAEWAEVHGNFYGTSRGAIDHLLGLGRDIIFDIDYQGARQLRVNYPTAVTIMLLPPSMAILEQRLRNRGTDSEETIQLRLQNARVEIAQYHIFDYLVVNDNLSETIEQVRAIVLAEKARRDRNAALAERLLRETEDRQ
jgi:guanylate kinase